MKSPIVLKESSFFAPGRNVYHQLLNWSASERHSHSFFEFTYVISGHSTHIYGDRQETLKPGDAYLVFGQFEHSFFQGDARFLHRDILIQNDFFHAACDFYSPHLYEKLTSAPLPFFAKIPDGDIARLERLCEENLYGKDAEEIGIYEKTLVNEILSLLLFQEQSQPEGQWLSRLITLLSAPEHMNEDLASILEQDFYFSKEYMCRAFKKRTGMTMTDFFNRNRMKHAFSLMATGFYTNDQIREMVGIKNASYFYRLCRKYKGLSNNQDAINISKKSI